jgi:formiminotetrahydrofolate cyclodeaminase
VPEASSSTVLEFLEAVGARTPAPASGAGAAVTGALAAALAELVARFGGDEPATAEAKTLRTRLLRLADEDSEAYVAFMATRSDADRDRTIDVPVAIAEAAAGVRDLASALVQRANPSTVGDAEAAAELAGAAARVGARLVEINLRGAEDPRLARARAAAHTN